MVIVVGIVIRCTVGRKIFPKPRPILATFWCRQHPGTTQLDVLFVVRNSLCSEYPMKV